MIDIHDVSSTSDVVAIYKGTIEEIGIGSVAVEEDTRQSVEEFAMLSTFGNVPASTGSEEIWEGVGKWLDVEDEEVKVEPNVSNVGVTM